MKRLHIGTFEITVRPADKRCKPARVSAHGIVAEMDIQRAVDRFRAESKK